MGVIRSFWLLNCETFNRLYKGLVHPHLEYAIPVWSRHLKKDKTKIESVQRRATKQINSHVSYGERLKQLKLQILLHRRLRGDMIEVYKILNHKYDSEVSSFLPCTKQ